MLSPVPLDWRAGAACVGAPLAVFFPEGETLDDDDDNDTLDTAPLPTADDETAPASWCSRCRVRIACLETALDLGRECVGIWGGLGSAKRRHLRQARTRQTAERYRTHRYTPGCSCSFCLLASAYLAGDVVNRNTTGARCGYRSSYGRNCRCAACVYAAALHTRLSNVVAA